MNKYVIRVFSSLLLLSLPCIAMELSEKQSKEWRRGNSSQGQVVSQNLQNISSSHDEESENNSTNSNAVRTATRVHARLSHIRQEGPRFGAGEVYLSMTTSPERLENLQHILYYLLYGDKGMEVDLEKVKDDQQFGIDDLVTKIIINIPNHFRNDEDKVYNDRQILALTRLFGDKIFINRLKRDLGPISKLLPTIKLLQGRDKRTAGINKRDALVISIDDDHYYHPSRIRKLIMLKRNNPQYIISYGGAVLSSRYECPRGMRFPNRLDDRDTQTVVYCAGDYLQLLPSINAMRQKKRKQLPQDPINAEAKCGFTCDIVEGYGAIAYSVKQVNYKLMKLLADERLTDKNCRLSDDIIISFVLSLEGKTRIKLNTDPQKDNFLNRRLGFFYYTEHRHRRVWLFPELKTEGALQSAGGYSEEEQDSIAQKQKHLTGKYKNVDAVKYRDALTTLYPICYYQGFKSATDLKNQLVAVKKLIKKKASDQQ